VLTTTAVRPLDRLKSRGQNPFVFSEVHLRIRSLLITAVLVYLIAAVPASQAQTQVPAQPTVTLQAELLKTIEASHAKVGDEITARTATPLEIAGLKFRSERSLPVA